MHPTDPEELPPPVVAPERYDRRYYLEACAGHEEWARSAGASMAGIYPGVLSVAGFEPGEALVDIGTGRGELLAAAVEAGATRAVGIEYSQAAIEMARETLAARDAGARAELLHADARRIDLEDGVADVVTMIDVVEHLARRELDATLTEALRVLRPGGRIVIHTMPNRHIYDTTYRLQRLARPHRLRTWPRDPRNHWEHEMHVNEQSRGSLRRALRRSGFAAVDVRFGEWVYADFVPEDRPRALYHRLAAHRPTAWLGRGDLWARGERSR